MTKPPKAAAENGRSEPWKFARTAAVAAALFLGACAGGGTEVAATGPQADAAAAAAVNIPTLNSTAATVFDIEVLDVADGGVTTLNEVVDGDRPVLLWFWSPH